MRSQHARQQLNKHELVAENITAWLLARPTDTLKFTLWHTLAGPLLNQ
jgi:hypothetical protein